MDPNPPKIQNLLSQYKVKFGLVILAAIIALIFFVLYFKKTAMVITEQAVDCSKVSQVDNATVIRIQDNQFDPKDLTVKVCDTIMFLSLDEGKHWPVSDGLFDASKDLVKYDYYIYRAEKAGVYTYYDKSHRELGGKITVEK